MNATLETPRPSIARKAVLFLILALLGGFVGYGVATLTDGTLTTWEDDVALVMSVVMISTGVISAFLLVTRPSTIPRGCGLLQVVVMLLAGGMFLLPMFGPAWAAPNVIFAAILALLLLQSVANLMLWRAADEMLRRIMSETSAMAFWVVQLGLFIYAAAERLGLVETITGWGLIGLLMGVYFVSSIIASARRGIH